MPTVHSIKSIKIDVYSREHLPPHFHAIYAEHEILVVIETLETYAGYLPTKQYNLVIEWANKPGSKEFLKENFERLNPNLKK